MCQQQISMLLFSDKNIDSSQCWLFSNISFMFFVLIFVRWLLPFIGHMGIAMSSGVIRDFAGPYYVSVSYSEKWGLGYIHTHWWHAAPMWTQLFMCLPPNFWECCPSLGTKSWPCTQALDPALAPVCTQFVWVPRHFTHDPYPVNMAEELRLSKEELGMLVWMTHRTMPVLRHQVWTSQV